MWLRCLRLLRSPLSLRFLSFWRCRLLCALFCGLTVVVRRLSSRLLHGCLLCGCLLLRGLLNLLWRPLCLRLLLALLCLALLALLGLSLFALLVAAGCNRGGGLLGSGHS